MSPQSPQRRVVRRVPFKVPVGWAAVLGLALAVGALAPLGAQTLGSFRWQLVPFCNVLTLTVVQQGGQYQIDGTDDLCGAGQQASVVGRAFPNPDGSIGFGLTTVSTTGAAPVHLDVRLDVGTIGGPWTDSAGNRGTFVFTPGAGSGGSPRPIPSGGIAPGAVTSVQLAPGAINQAVAAFGTCPAGQYLRGLLANGTVLCEPIGTTPLSTTADAAANVVGIDSSIAIGADGLPIISHRDATTSDLRVTHCSDASCTSATSTNVDTTGNVGSNTSIAIGVDGLPIISHRDGTLAALRVTHCNDVACTSATSTTVDDPANAVGSFTSIAIGADGLPIVSHLDSTQSALRVTHCSNIACTAATSTTVDDPANQVGSYTSIAIGTDGLAIISHFDGSAGDLRVTHCSNVACTAATSTSVDTPGFVGLYTSIAIGADGLPIVSHWDNSAMKIDLRVTHCTNVACTAATSTSVDTANDVGSYSSIAIGTDGLAIVSHHDATRGDLRVTHCSDIACTAATSISADTANTVGRYTAIATGADGLPIISHHDTAGDLRVTKCNSRTCQ